MTPRRLTKADKDLICTMCSIAESNFDVANTCRLPGQPVRGEGDYEGWTEADFKRADAIFEKLFDAQDFAKKISGGAA